MVNKKESLDKNLKIFNKEDVMQHVSPEDCWVTVRGGVYNVTKFLKNHPGGPDLILTKAGSDVTNILTNNSIHQHSLNAYKLLEQYKIGCIDEQDEEYSQMSLMEGWNENLVDWNKGMVFQVHKLGHNYLKWVHSPVNKKLKLFDSEFVEFFSKTPWYVIPLVWIPIIIIVSMLSINEMHETISDKFKFENIYVYKSLALACFCFSFSIGLPLWTLIEYMLHRYLFHLEPKGPSFFWITMHFFFHGQHHKVPFDEMRLVFPPACASVFAFLLNYLLVSVLPHGIGRAVFAGGMLGYVIYDLTHYYLHHGSPARGSWFHSLKYYHVLHHFDDHSTGFGISTKLWDYPFSTVNKKFLEKSN
ncbi:fatty acid 2-hydroxylase isoform X2 [Hydra vulgaris]|uniref:Fatty acid 2-hydroxylase n=1 Tax=Hydra vulgaris TaxID=6087 RepID=A0ABM4DPF0_HYDVU